MASATVYPTLFEWITAFNRGDDINEERLIEAKKELHSILGIVKEEDK